MFSHRIVCISKQNWNAPRVYWEVIIRLSHRLDAEILVMPPLKKEKIEGGKHLPQYQHIVWERLHSWRNWKLTPESILFEILLPGCNENQRCSITETGSHHGCQIWSLEFFIPYCLWGFCRPMRAKSLMKFQNELILNIREVRFLLQYNFLGLDLCWKSHTWVLIRKCTEKREMICGCFSYSRPCTALRMQLWTLMSPWDGLVIRA